MKKALVQLRFPHLKPEELDPATLHSAKAKVEADLKRWADDHQQLQLSATEYDVKYLEGHVAKGQPPFTGTVITGLGEVEDWAAVSAMYQHYSLRAPLKGDSQWCQVPDCPKFADRTLLLENVSTTEHDGRVLRLYLCDDHARHVDKPASA